MKKTGLSDCGRFRPRFDKSPGKARGFYVLPLIQRPESCCSIRIAYGQHAETRVLAQPVKPHEGKAIQTDPHIPTCFARYTFPMRPVSIIATELNEIGDIARVVESLLALEPAAAEVIIVDGGSTDGTWEWLAEAAAREPRLIAIRDESCSLKHSKGPVSRGRNVAIAAAKSSIIACADAGCTYSSEWLGNLTAKISAGQAEYALGGTCLDPAAHTVSDVASAPFFSVRLSPLEPTQSCTARTMAFTKDLWQRIGGFSEQVLVGEDTLFDLEARGLTRPDFVINAKATYRPLNTFRSACRQMKRYAISDGQAGSALVAALPQFLPLPVATRRAHRCAMDSFADPWRFSARILVRLSSRLAISSAIWFSKPCLLALHFLSLFRGSWLSTRFAVAASAASLSPTGKTKGRELRCSQSHPFRQCAKRMGQRG